MSKPTVANTLTWQEVAPGVWRGLAGKADDFTPLTAAGSAPRIDALAALPEVTFPLNSEEIWVQSSNGKTYVRFPLAASEDIYGLGLDFQSLRRNGTVQRLKIDAWSGNSGRTHAPVPFYVSSEGYGVLINSARYIEFYVGTTLRVDAESLSPVIDRNTGEGWQAIPPSNNIEVYLPAEGVEVFVFAGPSILDAVRRFNLFNGGGSLPPKWGLGITHRTPTLFTDDQVRAEANEYETRGFPLDFLGLEPGWHNFSYPCSFEWDEKRFPEPKKVVDDLYARGVRVNLWFNPYVAPLSSLYPALKPLSGSHTVWNGIVPDYSLPQARQVFADHLKKAVVSLGPGIGGFKIDEVDGHDKWLWPDVATFPSGHDAEQLRQTYGLLLQRLTYDLFHKENRRTYGLVRGSNAGASRFPFVIYSDSYNFEEYITALCNSGFSGILWTPEVRNAKTSEEWVRRIQAVCFSPMAMINAWTNGTKPWTFEDVSEPVRQILLLRLRLMPYLYTTFAQYYYHGTPPIRAMPMVPGFFPEKQTLDGVLDDTLNPYEQAHTSEIKDQYMLGDNLLVAPVAPGEKSRTVVFPPGKWFDFYSGTLVSGSTITVTPPLDQIPLYVKNGGIIPLLADERLHIPKANEISDLEVRHYGDAPGEFLLYDDDGETFDYEQGHFSWTSLQASKEGGQWKGEVLDKSQETIFSYKDVRWKFCSSI